MTAMNAHTVTINTPIVGGTAVLLVQAPKAAGGGGLTITEAHLTNGSAVTTAGFAVNLVKYTGGTTNAGTVAVCGGTATGSRAPGVGTVLNELRGSVNGPALNGVWLAAGDAILVDASAVNSGTVCPRSDFSITYVMGRQSV
jgi:hypothetical protein